MPLITRAVRDMPRNLVTMNFMEASLGRQKICAPMPAKPCPPCSGRRPRGEFSSGFSVFLLRHQQPQAADEAGSVPPHQIDNRAHGSPAARSRGEDELTPLAPVVESLENMPVARSGDRCVRGRS